MRAELRNLHSPDLESLEAFCPRRQGQLRHRGQSSHWAGRLPRRKVVRLHGLHGQVASSQPTGKGVAFLHGHLLLTRWDFGLVTRAISDLCSHAEGEDWNEIATALSRLGYWEFDNYPE
jgi:Immunity protein 8